LETPPTSPSLATVVGHEYVFCLHTLFLFQYHGHCLPECTSQAIVKKNVQRGSKNCFGVSVNQLQLKNSKEKDFLLSLGSDTVTDFKMMWECKWHEFKKENPLLMPEIWRRTKLDPQRPLTRLTARAALRGGAIGTLQVV